MKQGFTMIELIFVIVILGVLAAVAIPKLNATRDDAELVKAHTNLKTIITDITSYYTSKGSFPEHKNLNLRDLTTVPLYHNSKCNPSKKGNAAWMKVGNTCECVLIKAGNGNGSGFYAISLWPANKIPKTGICKKFVEYLKSSNEFGGGYTSEDLKTPKSNLSEQDTYFRIGGNAVVW